MAPTTNNIEFREFQTKTLGWFYSACVDSQNPDVFYIVGRCTDEGQGSNECYIAKINKSDLSINIDKIYGGSGADAFLGVCEYGDFVYAVGRTASEGQGSYDGLIIKFKKSDLSISARKIYGGASSDSFQACATDGVYVYAAGETASEGTGGTQSLIVEFNVADLTINARKFGDHAAATEYWGVKTDGTNVFACGSYTAGSNKQFLLEKFDINGLANMDSDIGTAWANGDANLWEIALDTNYIYCCGHYRPDGSSAYRGVVVKFNKSDLAVNTAKKLTPNNTSHLTHFFSIAVDADKVYVVGDTNNEGEGGYDGLISILNKSDLSEEQSKLFGKTSDAQDEGFGGIVADSKFIYTASNNEFAGIAADFIFKFSTNLLITGAGGGYTVLAISTNTWSALTLAMSASTVTATNSTLTLANGTDTLADSSVTQAALSTIGTAAFSTYTNGDRILSVVQTETPFEDTAVIHLDNADKTFSALNMRGARVQLGFGFDSNYSNVPDMWVVRQEDISYQGHLITRLSLIGGWSRLAMLRVMGDAIAVANSTGSDTIKEAIEARMLNGMFLIEDSGDGLEDVVPNALYETFTPRRLIIQELIGLTDNLLFMRDSDMHMLKRNTSQQHQITGTVSGTFTKSELVTQAVTNATGKFVYQTATYIVIEAETGTFTISANQLSGGVSGATVSNPSAIAAFDYLYGPLAGAHGFYQYVRSQSVLEANRVMAVDKLPDTDATQHNWLGTVNDTADQTTFDLTTMIFEDPSIVDQQTANDAAASRLAHIVEEATGGILIAPMNCGQEMYDYIQVDDDRAGFTSGENDEESHRVGSIVRKYSPGVFTIELGFGGLTWARPDDLDLETVLDELAAAVSRGPEGVIPLDEDLSPSLPPSDFKMPEPPPTMFGGRETIQQPFTGPEREAAMSIESANIGESKTRQLTVKEIKQAMPWLSERELKKLRRLQQQQGWSRR